MTSVLVTGAGGYIGSVLTRLLIEKGHRVVAVDRFFFGRSTLPPEGESLTIVQNDIRRIAEIDSLGKKLTWAREWLVSSKDVRLDDPRGVYFADEPLASEGKVAFLFPGQGSQYVNMLGDLAIQFSEVRAAFERADDILNGQLPKPISRYIFPPPTFTEAEEHARQQELTQTDVAQPAMDVADVAMLNLLKKLGIEEDFTAGHSYGEFVALYEGGVFEEDDLHTVSAVRGRFTVEGAGSDPGTMAAIEAGGETVQAVLRDLGEDVVVANLNSPRQTVVSGSIEAVERVVEHFGAQGIRAKRIPVAVAFHSRYVAKAAGRLSEYLKTMQFRSPRLQVYSNTTAAAYPDKPEDVREILATQLLSPVRFVEQVQAMYEAGARVFIEVGPRGVLTGLAGDILGDNPHLAVATDQPGRHGLVQLQHALGQLAAQGVSVKLSHLFQGRSARKLDLKALDKETGVRQLSPTTWLVNGGGVRPLSEAVAEKSPMRVKVLGNGAGDEPASAEPTLPAREPVEAEAPATAMSTAAPSREVIQPAASKPTIADVPPLSNGSADEVVTRFQQLMGSFLDTQKDVMLAYLRGNGGIQAPDLQVGPVKEQFSAPVLPLPQAETSAIPALAPQAEPSALPEPQEQAALSQPAGQPEAMSTDGTQPSEPELTQEALAERLVSIVAERTGYPSEMIDLDADLEADLGIDSIKRVEILGTLNQSFAQERGLELDIETLSASKTLRAVIETILKASGSTPRPQDEVEPRSIAQEVSEEATSPPFEAASEEGAAQRFTLTAAETPLPPSPDAPVSNGVLVLTDDETGVAQSLSDALRDQGHAVALARMGQGVEVTNDGYYSADLTSPDAVAGLLETIRQRQGPIGGLVHLLPLRPGTAIDGLDLAAWRDRLQHDVKSLFVLSKALADDLAASARDEVGRK